MRLIDADKLKEVFAVPSYEAFGVTTICSIIDDAPTVDAKPVQHGRWLPYQTPIETRQSGWICNQCSGVVYDVSNGDTDYCPNCGAKMNLGVVKNVD